MHTDSIAAALAPLNLTSCLISRRDELILEQYRTNNLAGQLARTNSCTKSFLSALICIAMDEGLLPQADTPIAAFYPQLLRDPDERKAAITLRHLLTMTSGLRWTEFGGLNSFPAMTRTPNWVQYVLEQPLADEPGASMSYNSGNSQLLAALLAEAVGMPVAAYAEKKLFGPLGIRDYRWETDPQGVHTGGFGLWLRPADMLAFGRLFLQGGAWHGTPLISPARVSEATRAAIPAAPQPPRRGFYGWHWWTDTYAPEEGGGAAFDYFNAYGFGGQAIYVVPALDTVVVLTHDERKKNKIPLHVFRRHIAPVLAQMLLEQQKAVR
ncbi:serine hydrolase [Paenibacillus oryzisoli]|uniref:serine hydrolase domain-containing protein n=1 Tax=Paenibacillus oryzisoli TaxID=1850517 RepID=UPI003D285DA1